MAEHEHAVRSEGLSPARLSGVIAQYYAAKTQFERHVLIATNAWLLHRDVDDLLYSIAASVADSADTAAEGVGLEQYQALITEFRAVLRDCRTYGVDTVFSPRARVLPLPDLEPELLAAARALLSYPDPDSVPLRRLCQQHSVLLGDRFDGLLRMLIDQAEWLCDESRIALLGRHRRRLDEVRTRTGSAWGIPMDAEEASDLLSNLATVCGYGSTAGLWFRLHPQALSAEFDQYLERFIVRVYSTFGAAEAAPRTLISVARFALRFVRLCREIGFQAALARLDDSYAKLDDLQALVDELVRLPETAGWLEAEGLRETLSRWRELARHPGLLALESQVHTELHIWADELLDAIRQSVVSADLAQLSVEIAENGLVLPQVDPLQHAQLLSGLAGSLSDRLQYSLDPEDGRRAVALQVQALSLTPPDHPKRADLLNNCGAALRDLYRMADESAALDQAITYLEQAVSAGTETINRINLALALLDRSNRDEGEDDLDQAIAHFDSIAEGADANDPHLSRCFVGRTDALLLRYRRGNDRGDLDRALDSSLQAKALNTSGLRQAMNLSSYAEALAASAVASRSQAEFDEATTLFDQALAMLPSESPIVGAVGFPYVDACERWYLSEQSIGSLRDLVRSARTVLACVQADSALYIRVASVLADAAPIYALDYGDAADLDLAIRDLTEIERHADLAELSLPYGSIEQVLASLRLEQDLKVASIDGVDRCLAEIAALPVVEARRTQLLRRGLLARFELSLHQVDLDRFLRACEAPAEAESRSDMSNGAHTRILELITAGTALTDGSDLADVVARVSAERMPFVDAWTAWEYTRLVSRAYARRYKELGEPRDLERGARVVEDQLVIVPPENHEYRLLSLEAGCRLREWYAADGDPQRIAKAIRLLEYAVEASGPGEAVYSLACGNLGTAFRARFNYSGDLTDLERAIAGYERGLEDDEFITGEAWSIGASNLANALRASYEITHDQNSIDRSIDLHERAVAILPPGDPTRPERLNNLSTAYAIRRRTSESEADLARALEASAQSVQECPVGSPYRADYLLMLGGLHITKFQSSKDEAALQLGVEHCREAVRISRGSLRQRELARSNLAIALSLRFDHAGADRDRTEALEIFRDVCSQNAAGLTRIRLDDARSWAAWASEHERWDEAAEAYRLAAQLLDDLIRIQPSRGLRLHLLASFAHFPEEAAYALARAGDTGAAALTLETSRARSLTEILELDTADVGWLAEHGHAQLAEQFKAAIMRLRAASGEGVDRSLETEISQFDQHGFADRDAEIRSARTELDLLVRQIREVSGVDDFLRQPQLSDITSSGAEPLVYLAAAGVGGLALLIREGEIRVIDLPLLTRARVEDWVRLLYPSQHVDESTLNWWVGLESVAHELWDAAMGPIVEALGPGPVTMIPTGLAELLPLGAAWISDQEDPSGRRCAIDKVTLRIAPNARTLSAAAARIRQAVPHSFLAVEDPQPNDEVPLPKAPIEVAAACRYFGTRTVLAGTHATHAAVLSAMPEHEVVHFACHGRANQISPLDSSLLLADSIPLTLRDILRLRLTDRTPARLAVLSACKTSVIGLSAPGEVIGLPAGLLEAGWAGVVASQWRVSDLSAALLMIRFYATWMSGVDDPCAALRAAQQWMRESTNREKAEYIRACAVDGVAWETCRVLWRSLVRMDPDRHGFSHPAHWAGFVYVGA
jgi:tetratricopeptide (TPR) repeat protein